MGRLVAYISPVEPILLSDILITPYHAVCKQIADKYPHYILPHYDQYPIGTPVNPVARLMGIRNAVLSKDGIGVSWYTDAASHSSTKIIGPRPVQYRVPGLPINDYNFISLCQNTETRALFAHVHPKDEDTENPANTQPFVFGRHTFMHSGCIASFEKIKQLVCKKLHLDAFFNIQGTTDSEHLAALYMTNLTQIRGGGQSTWQESYPLQEMVDAVTKTVCDIMTLQLQALGKEDMTPSDFNICITDGEKLVAIRFRNDDTEEPRYLYWSNSVGPDLNHKFERPRRDAADVRDTVNHDAMVDRDVRKAKYVIVSSQPVTFHEKGWRLVGKNCGLAVDELGNVNEFPVRLDTGVDALGPSISGQDGVR